jgi:tubulin-specific chaperone D
VCRTCCTIISSSEVIRPSVSLYACFEAALSGLDRQATVRFFPHEVADLAVALEFAQILNRAQSSTTLWSTQHVALLWISLICMIPFDLAQFDEVGREGQTAATIEAIAKQSLTSSGIVRESAAILLSRLYVRYQICKVSYPVHSTHYRRDVLQRLPAFLDWAKTCAKEQKDIFEVHRS